MRMPRANVAHSVRDMGVSPRARRYGSMGSMSAESWFESEARLTVCFYCDVARRWDEKRDTIRTISLMIAATVTVL